jgi:hypothetical protein
MIGNVIIIVRQRLPAMDSAGLSMFVRRPRAGGEARRKSRGADVMTTRSNPVLAHGKMPQKSASVLRTLG